MQQFAEQAQANKEKEANKHQGRTIIDRQHHSKDFVHGCAASVARKEHDKNLTAEDQPWNHKAEKTYFLKGIN